MFSHWPYLLSVGLQVMVLGNLASRRVKRTYEQYAQVGNASGQCGVDVARRILAWTGLDDVTVHVIGGELSDHYDPWSRRLNLSRGVAMGTSVAAEAVVAHEIGHAQQDRQGYFAMRLRAALVPAANLGSQTGPMIVITGLLLAASTRTDLGLPVALFGLILLAGVVAFQLIATPVELDASRRALGLLALNGAMDSNEREAAHRVLGAAAVTYWVALFGAPLTVLSNVGSRRDD